MIIAILNGEQFKEYPNINEAREDLIKFFKFVTSYKEQETADFEAFIANLKYLSLEKFNKMDYTIKLQEV